jgi:oligoendopeptidase F
VRRDLLANALDDAYITVMRQAYFTIFEKDAHEMIAANASLDELTGHYMKNLREQFGDAVELSDEFKWEWISIPHFYHSPFYTYAYSFGQLLVLALYQQYRIEGEAFIPRYLKLLTYGGSEAPAKILTEAGLDISSSDFWQGGFDVLEKMIAELDQLSQGDIVTASTPASLVCCLRTKLPLLWSDSCLDDCLR